MALTHERNKSPKTRRGCLLCYNIGAAAPTFAYITVTFIPMYRKVDPVQKEIGLCFRHCKPKTVSNPNGILDIEFGPWIKTPFGKMPIREEMYQLVGGPNNTTLLTGPSGKIPLWW